MTFRHAMTSFVQGIRITAPLKWRMLDGIVADFWQAEGDAGGGGFYLAPDPRIMIFLDEVGPQIRIAEKAEDLGLSCRPMARVLYVPA
ncbi:MAG TPA: AraC family transcriptional regulator, partial [Paenirhodobacter sp.]